ncbi:Alpha/Beta hydrolase protein [Rhexocercosporidium sp. MPI-PUGE-AT-0058]|nr:Alpha/Beta hydrolase protein [Rhexocercosporidium sp. MPI-PUGE-AT-0058]
MTKLKSSAATQSKLQANNGLRDQKVAFEWIKAHIEEFGGDSNQVTALGQSAGGVSLNTHEQFYLEFCKAQGFEGISGDDRIRAIEDRESLELLLKTPPSISSLPALDHDLLKEQISFEKAKHWSNTQQHALPGLEWCKEIVFGDCEYDASIYVRAITGRGSNVAQQLSDSLNRALLGYEPAISALLDDYGISNAVNNGSAYHTVSHLANDLSFYLPCDVFAQFFPGRRYIYHLNEPNLLDGPFKGETAHIVDVTFLFKNFDEFLPTRTMAVAQAFSDNIIKFISGEVPWEASSGENRVALVYGNDAGVGQLRKDEPESVSRRATIFRYQELIGFDALLNAVSDFLAGK